MQLARIVGNSFVVQKSSSLIGIFHNENALLGSKNLLIFFLLFTAPFKGCSLCFELIVNVGTEHIFKDSRCAGLLFTSVSFI